VGPLCWLLAAAACWPATASEGRPPEKLPDIIEVISSATLEETPEAINVSPRISVDSHGGFIVADPSENQIRVYETDGRLRTFFGRRGEGPGEFNRVSKAVRLPDGRIGAADIAGRLTIFDSAGATISGSYNLPLYPVYDLAVVDDSLIAITGRINGSADSPLVHLWNVPAGALVRSFFHPKPPTPEMASAYGFAGAAAVAIRGDTAAVVFALSDTLYLYTLQGVPVARRPLSLAGFRRMTRSMPDDPSQRALQEWLESFSAINQVFMSANGTTYVQYFDMHNLDRSWTVAGYGSGGAKVFEIPGSPMLLAVDPADSRFVFSKPGSDTANELIFARLRP
jgi:hypothetical protein